MIKIPGHLKNSRKDRHDDGKVNTSVEMVNASEEALWEKNPVEALKFERKPKKIKIQIKNFVKLKYIKYYNLR